MYSNLYDQELDDFLSEIGIEFSADYGRIYLIAFHDASMKILHWLVVILKVGFSQCVSPIAFSDRVSTSRGDDVLIMSAVYTERIFDTLVDLLPEIKQLYYERVKNGFFG